MPTISTKVQPDGTVTVDVTDEAVAKQEWDGSTVRVEVVKAVAERQYTLSMGYPAYQSDIAKARDGFKDFASNDEIEKAAWNYLASGAGVGLKHADGTDGAGLIVESYIYRGPDWPQDNGKVIKEGDWLIGTIWSDQAWAEIKAGEIRGTSMQGRANRRTPTPADVARVKARG